MPGKQIIAIEVKGKDHLWSFHFYGDAADLETWQEDGLVVNQVCNVTPVWVKDLGLARPWCFVQDVLAFRWPFGRWK